MRWFENAVYLAELKEAIVYLRVTPARRRTLEEIRAEVDLLEYLKAADFPATRLVPTKSGELFASTFFNDQEMFLLVFTDCAGVEHSINPDCSDIGFYRCAGRTMGQLHRLLNELQSSQSISRKSWRTDRWPNFSDVVPASERAAWSAFEELRNWWNGLDRIFDSQLIHGDFTIRNIRRVAAGISLFDFDGCCEHFRAYEAACFLHHFRNLPAWHLAQVASNFLEGYSETNDLSDEFVESLPLFCKMKLLRSFMVLYEEIEREPDAGLEDTVQQRRGELSAKSPWNVALDA